MGHIHTGENECDFTASAYIVREFPDELWRILLHRHKKLGVLLQIGGHVELTETPWQALTHELKEESGYDIAELVLFLSPPLLGLVDCDEQPAPFSMLTHSFSDGSTHRHTDLSYAFIARDEPKQLPAEGEAQTLTWLTDAELVNLPEQDIYENVRQLGRFVLSKVS